MKAVVAAFNQEKALVISRGLLRDCTTSPINRLQHYLRVVDDVEVLPLLEAEVLVGPGVVVVQRHEDLVLVHCTQRSHTRQPDTRTTIWRSENY